MRRKEIAEARLIIGRTVLAILRAAGRSRTGSENVDVPHDAEATVIIFAVYIGQQEGRPFRATKLAQYLGMPRPTLVRKLRQMRDSGFIEQRGPLIYVPDSYLNRPESMATAREMQAIVFAASRQLSKLDTLPVDTRVA